ncbi:MAG: YCF48-related protein, partial [Bacillota bacterium]
TWNAKFSFVVQQYLRQIIFTDKNTGYVCGGSTAAADSLGYILKTTDGGATWTQLPFNFKTQMYTLAMPTADVWYVAGGANSIFKTTDGGKTFVKQTSPVTTATHVYWTSAFVNKDLGYIGGVSGKLVKTTDGGTTWKEVTSNFGTSSIFKMAMPDTGTLIMGGLNAKLSKTTDGGATWTALTPGISGTIFSMKFKDSKFGYIGANNAGVAKTTDGGNTWIPQTLPQSVSTNATVWSLAFSDSAVWAITGNGEICKIGNKDTLWTVASKFVTTPLSDIEAKGNDLWVVGNNGVIIKGTPEVTSAVGENNIAVCNFDLMQNYPNPFNPATTIKYTIPAEGKVSLKIYNVLGKEVAQLINQNQSAGQHSVSFNASELSSGVYFYQLTFGSNVSVKKMMLVK